MCGRYARSHPDPELVDLFDVAEIVGDPLPASYNIAPTQDARAVLERAPREDPDAEPTRQLRTLRWGLVPVWAKDTKIGNRMVNARVETITDKPAFKRAAAKRRLLVPADGYYEWEKREGRAQKVPHFLHAEHDDGTDDITNDILAFAGLYELWPDPAKEKDDPDRWLWTFTILTTQASDALGRIHDRTPVIVPADMRDDWLDPTLTDLDLVQQVLDALPEPRLATHEVSTAVNSPRNNTPDLLTPAPETPA
ncbi:SOS response-associated peptidase [Kineococcus rhizosphaerae]|uniref:Abasic site processing protein n=1 Tax=Kineococcus rhizosphaerae TaxID=559628 RepID=A0A2T0QKV2_9ACTN|nr:SOS response-associated peptidase [Kineococcus rhizosphaerae]PRY04919.1 putative SOS response-associated peptidase YedK [Kineococcus rhizosphaerae]